MKICNKKEIIKMCTCNIIILVGLMLNHCSSASIGLLEAKLSKIQTELSAEQRLEQTLIESLKQAELVNSNIVNALLPL